MANYVLIPGAGGSAWYWHRLVPELRGRGHDVVAVDLPAGDDSAGFAEYAEVVIDAIGNRDELVVVAQSLGPPFDQASANSGVIVFDRTTTQSFSSRLTCSISPESQTR